ncbi:hypothetical protein T440DRAFT_557802 [Plenodomus tracheiphilus IPT5]|uniref:DUF4360 domain-containing protein n=1 Tax=Plenodomus tracheiphilus IPT5 TaxID=1408161 RepID=A0A6A7AWZ1_9PLEO|nr:hypothetical protein T440DRAFT_557802 [Plenodomus tracheiphilus IPT5]
MKYTLPTLALAATALAAPTNIAPPAFKITNVVSGGSGCPQGSIDVSWTDSKVLPIYFTQAFTAKTGPSTDITLSRKNCQLTLALSFTPGYSFSLLSADYTGYGDLDAGITGVVKSTYYFSGDKDQTSTTLTVPGPFKGRYYKNDDVGVSVWSECGGEAALNVNSEVALSPLGAAGSGVLAQTKESARVSSSLFVQWRKC